MLILIKRRLAYGILIALLGVGSLALWAVAAAPARVSAQNPSAPTCYNTTGERQVACQNAATHGLQPGKCYTETRGGPNGVLTGYGETNCNDATDRDQDGIGSSGRVVADCQDENINSSNCKIISRLADFVRALSAVVGVVIVGSIVYAGIRYSMSKDNPQATAAARERIRDALIALVAYIFMFAFLQWLVPGGLI